ncbi:MAG: hypothetical protein LQ337_009001, partial [Flavoplaca oasis]
CGKPGHPAWDRNCTIRWKERNRASQKIAAKTPLYGVRREQKEQPRADAEGFTVIAPRKRKATEDLVAGGAQGKTQANTGPKTAIRVGRPPKLASAEVGQTTLKPANSQDTAKDVEILIGEVRNADTQAGEGDRMEVEGPSQQLHI